MGTTLRIFLGVIVGIILVVGGVLVYIQFFVQGTKTLAQETLCNGTLSIQSMSVNINAIEEGPKYGVDIFYVRNNDKKLVGSISKRSWDAFHPLPRNTNIPVSFIEAQDVELSGSPYASVDNVLVDPGKFTRAEFDEMGACAKKEAGAINKLIAETPTLSGEVGLHIGGLTYATFNQQMELVRQLAPDPVFKIGEEVAFQINPWGTIFYNRKYTGDIFNGLVQTPEYYGSAMGATNSMGEPFDQYFATLNN